MVEPALSGEHRALVAQFSPDKLMESGAGGRLCEIPSAPHGFAVSPTEQGFKADLVNTGRGGEAEFRQSWAVGKIALIDGMVAQSQNLVAERAGAGGSVRPFPHGSLRPGPGSPHQALPRPSSDGQPAVALGS